METRQGRPKRLDGLIINDEAEAPSFLDPMSGHIFVTNRVGKRIMQLADGTLGFEEIVDAVAREFKGAAREVVARDARAFLDESTAKGLITWHEP